MLDTKQTLINLHTKFPDLSLDDLFEMLDCYVEQYPFLKSFPNPYSFKPYQYEVTCTDHMYNKFLNKQ